MIRKFPNRGTGAETVNETDILEKLRAFRARVDRMESQQERLVKSHPDHWVALHSGDFVLAESLDDLLKMLQGQGVPAAEAVIRFLDSNPKNMIL
ncbi:MAG: hypothetical protein OXF11_05080 [Deltaproteobacteria bacterium]|nr:hypothetical protein [Deltaproteobacteria bacterium]